MGAVVHYVEAPIARVSAALPGDWEAHETAGGLPDALPLMLPFEAPWTRLLAAQCGGWTALTNNALNGGDSTAPGPALSGGANVQQH
jgi:hypothetical protein